VCAEWVESFDHFEQWAKVNGYTDALELDRRDTNGNYEPGNCRWATRCEQMQNSRKRKNAVTSKYKGVSWCSNVRKWRVQLHRDGKPFHGGLFLDELNAAKCYDRLAIRMYGQFAHLNFPRASSELEMAAADRRQRVFCFDSVSEETTSVHSVG
jgi:hypothetical protein